MRYSVLTFGCRVNQADSLGFEETLGAAGARPVSPQSADLVIVNTCSVTASAEQGARQAVRRVARQNPSARIVVTGCYATRDPEAVSSLPNVVRVIPNPLKPRLVPLVAEALGLTTAERFGSGDGSCGASLEPGIAGRTAFTLRVQTGCGQSCSYCIIPATRGTPLSLPPDMVLQEAARVVAAGFKEIAITGVHLGSYGRDLPPRASLSALLARLVVAHPDTLFRISSLEPMDCTPEIVSLAAENPAIAPHFHLPLQHASRSILAAMRRPYTIQDYAALVDELRARVPAAAIGADVIVGFPGEREEDVDELAAYLRQSPLTHLHVFPYSDRPGTEAARLGGCASGVVVRDRASRIREIGADLTQRFRAAQVGSVRRALTTDDGSHVVTDNYLKLRIPPGRLRNQWIDVRVIGDGEGAPCLS